MDKLPLELGELIFQYVEDRYQLRMGKGKIGGFISAVLALRLKFSVKYNMYMDLVVNTFPLIQDLNFCCDIGDYSSDFKAIGCMKNLRKLYIECDQISCEDMSYICKGESRHLLEDLYIEYVQNSSMFFDLTNVAHLSNLKRIHICCENNKGVINALCTGRSYHTLEILSGIAIHDYNCKVIGELPALRKLVLFCACIGDKGLKIICDNANLESLSFMECAETELSNNGLKEISSLTQLKTLILDEMEISNDCLSTIGQNCTALEELTVTIHPYIYDTDSALHHFPNLKLLNLGCYDMDDNGLYIICTKMVSLEELHVKYCKDITADAFSMIKNLQKLKLLELGSWYIIAINEKSLSAILTIPTLCKLTIPEMCNKLMESQESHHFEYVDRQYGKWAQTWVRK